jgi:hypothetical protein
MAFLGGCCLGYPEVIYVEGRPRYVLCHRGWADLEDLVCVHYFVAASVDMGAVVDMERVAATVGSAVGFEMVGSVGFGLGAAVVAGFLRVAVTCS